MTDNLRGAGWMVLAMAGFSIEDMFLKSAAQRLPVGQVMMLFGAGGFLGFALWVTWRREALLCRAMLARAVLLRAGFEGLGRLGYTLAIALTPLSSASAILQAAPLVVVAGAALVFRERVGWRRWSAILVGFAGVLVILRPGLDGFQPASVLALIGMLGFAGRDLATRAARGLSNPQLGMLGFAVMVPVGAALMAREGGWIAPDLSACAALLAATLFGIAAYAALTGAMRTGEVSFVTPFRYSRLLFGIGLGITVFAERPDAMTLLGSAIVLAAGIYTFVRERRIKG